MTHRCFQQERKTMRVLAVSLLLCVSAVFVACGSGSVVSPSTGLSGNWVLTLQRHAHPVPVVYTGFLLQSGSSVAGSVILGGGCDGVGPVVGTLDGANLSLTINEFGQDVSLTGTLPTGSPSGSTFIGGAFSSVAGGCADFVSTGTWSAVRVTPLSGTFHGTLVGVSNSTTDTFNVTGTLTQGANTASSNAMLSGSITATGAPHFCAYLSTATITGLISGTGVTLNLFDSTGNQITQIAPASVATTGTSLTCAQGATSCFTFPAISNACTGEQGTIQLSFP
jgi:hypothetical protein